MAYIIAVANNKGGVGKTTTTVNLGVGLHQQGKRVLLVDLDPQSALTVSLGVKPTDIKRSIYDVLVDEDTPPAEVIIPTTGGPDILPATLDLSAAELELVSEIGREGILRDALATVADNYDFMLIDCNPSLGLLTVNALVAANGVLIPLQTEYLAMRGLQLLLRSIEKVRVRLNPGLELLGILPTMYDGRTAHSKEVLEVVRDTFPGKVFDVVIKSSVRFKEAPFSGQSMLDYARTHEGSQAYRKLAEVIANGR